MIALIELYVFDFCVHLATTRFETGFLGISKLFVKFVGENGMVWILVYYYSGLNSH